MPRGQPDFGMYAVKEVGASVSDMAEQAVRLGSIVEYDRRGDVIYLDDYESPVMRFSPSTIFGGKAFLDSTIAYGGAQCVEFLTEGNINDYVRIDYQVSPMITGRHGCRIALASASIPQYDSKYEILIEFYDGSHLNRIGIELNPYTKTLKCQTGLAAFTTFETDFRVGVVGWSTFHNIKVVYDLDTGKYMRFMFDNLIWDISAYSFYKVGDAEAPNCMVRFKLTDLGGEVLSIYQDNFVYTINEP